MFCDVEAKQSNALANCATEDVKAGLLRVRIGRVSDLLVARREVFALLEESCDVVAQVSSLLCSQPHKVFQYSYQHARSFLTAVDVH